MRSIEKKVSNISDYIRKNQLESVLLFVILIIGAILRLYRIDEYMTFLGDEGRDAIVVMRLLKNFDPILVGPGTSVGDMYLGPFYYYLMAPALLLSNFSPVGPAIMIAVFSLATTLFIWYVVKTWFEKSSNTFAVGGLLAAFLYAVSPVVINLSRFSWNPNIMPFFALLVIYSLWQVWTKNNWKWFILAGFSFAVSLQSHYMALVLFPIFIFFWILSYKNSWIRGSKKEATKYTVLSFIIFSLLLSPLVLFDARHGWRNFTAMQEFFLERGDTVSAVPLTSIKNVYQNNRLVFMRLLGGGEEANAGIVMTVFSLLLVWLFVFKREKYHSRKLSAYFLIFLWLFVGILGLSLYKLEVYDHYFGYLFPAPFILMGGIIQDMFDSKKKLGLIVAIFLVGVFGYFSLKNNPFRFPPARQMQRSIAVAEKIKEEANANKFNIAVIAERNYEGAYWYFLELWGEPIVGIDPQKADETITEQLYVICEYEDAQKCQPTSNPKTEVANFGWSKIEDAWVVEGVHLYKLVHNFPEN